MDPLLAREGAWVVVSLGFALLLVNVKSSRV
jgi:hypothetical protein